MSVRFYSPRSDGPISLLFESSVFYFIPFDNVFIIRC